MSVTKPIHWAITAGATEVPLPSILLTLINIGMRWHSSQWTCGGTGTTDVPKQGHVPDSLCKTMICCCLGSGHGAQSDLVQWEWEWDAPEPRFLFFLLLLLLCPGQHSARSLWIRLSYGWPEKDGKRQQHLSWEETSLKNPAFTATLHALILGGKHSYAKAIYSCSKHKLSTYYIPGERHNCLPFAHSL